MMLRILIDVKKRYQKRNTLPNTTKPSITRKKKVHDIVALIVKKDLPEFVIPADEFPEKILQYYEVVEVQGVRLLKLGPFKAQEIITLHKIIVNWILENYGYEIFEPFRII